MIWLTGREVSGGEPSDAAPRIHAVKGAATYCEFEGEVEVQRLLWVDRPVELQGGLAVECQDCLELTHVVRGTSDDEMVAIYSARQTEKDRDLQHHVANLEPSFADGDSRLDIARTQFDDGIGCTFTIWRRTSPRLP